MNFKLLKHKVKKGCQIVLTCFSRSYKQKYYTELAYSKLQCAGIGLIVKGRIKVSDWNQLIVGKNVTIGSGCTFLSDGGIYIEDNAEIGNNVFMSTLLGKLQVKELGYSTIDKLKPIFICGTRKIMSHAKIVPAAIPDDFTTLMSTDKKHRFFIVSTGRSGTKSIAETLNEHPQISCKHEPYMIFNRISTEYAYNFKSEREVLYELYFFYKKCSFSDELKENIIECDWKYSNLICLLKKIFPESKFIWLIRKADSFVSSANGRGWFDDYEFNYPFSSVFSEDRIADKSIFDEYRMFFARYRLNGAGLKEVTESEWKKMNSFDRCCWFWNYWNQMIEKNLNEISSDDKMLIRLESFSSELSKLLFFIKVSDDLKMTIKHSNKAYYKKNEVKSWSPNQKMIYNHFCSRGMKKWCNVEENN
jgi:hypothetical protein